MIDKSKREQIAKRVLEIARNWSGIDNINEDTRFVDLISNSVKQKASVFWKAIEDNFGIGQCEYRGYILAMAEMKEVKHFTTVGNLISLIVEEATLKENEELTREEVSAEVLRIFSDLLDESVCEDDVLPAPDIMLNSWGDMWQLIRTRFHFVPSKKAIILFTVVGDIVDYIMKNGDLSRNSDEKCEVEERDVIPKEVECRGRNGWFQFCEVNVSVIEPNVWVHFWSKRRGDNPPIAIDGPVDQVLKIFEGIVADIRGQMKGGNK